MKFLPDECLQASDIKGELYRGTVSTTMSGHRCQYWRLTSPNQHNYTPDRFEKFVCLSKIINQDRDKINGNFEADNSLTDDNSHTDNLTDTQSVHTYDKIVDTQLPMIHGRQSV